MAKNLHEGHRERLKRRFIEQGLDGFEDHQVLELLLFFSIPRRDTNDVAHRLISTFGSISNVFEAHPEDLQKVNGIGKNSAILISLISQISRRYLADKNRKTFQLRNVEVAAEYIKSLFVGRKNEVFYVICLDTQLNVIYSAPLFEGTVKEAVVYPRKVVECVIRYNASSVILAHNHPGGSIRPSMDDIKTTQKIVNALSTIGVAVNDHFIVAGDKYYSFAQNGILPKPQI
ncbi:DNA repair protein RadC [Caldicellulosiruptor owensensis OL]|uniref:DNA repair protein RadC n=1 Tax=Caldicellulosiruptor owensensis (strain ATCC 700167 / DSM 13100 / OL) TaxID=632518 RepID=E4Q3W5_CALOW|nr:DNA repair protein RadC [Caldicellulosiruptor owensensis]ADQ04000.1 DNA repair protein RadC [Caldicellulosiruptor owensensis OL]